MNKLHTVKNNYDFDEIIKNNQAYKYKRRLRSIIDKNNYNDGFSCIIILGKGILNRTYKEMETNLIEAFKKINIIKEKKNEEKI